MPIIDWDKEFSPKLDSDGLKAKDINISQQTVSQKDINSNVIKVNRYVCYLKNSEDKLHE